MFALSLYQLQSTLNGMETITQKKLKLQFNFIKLSSIESKENYTQGYMA